MPDDELRTATAFNLHNLSAIHPHHHIKASRHTGAQSCSRIHHTASILWAPHREPVVMPSNAMLAVPAKGAAGFLDIREPIKSYVASQFGRSAASGASATLEKAQKLRNSATEMSGGADEVKDALLGCDHPRFPRNNFFLNLSGRHASARMRSGTPQWTCMRRSCVKLLCALLQSCACLSGIASGRSALQSITSHIMFWNACCLRSSARMHVRFCALLHDIIMQEGALTFRYYRFLSSLEAALPVGKERGGVPLRFKVRLCQQRH